MALFIVAGIDDVLPEEALAALGLMAGNSAEFIETETRLFSLDGVDQLFDDNVLTDTNPNTIEFWQVSVLPSQFPDHTDQPDTAGPSLIKFLVENGENYLVGYPSSVKVMDIPIEAGGVTIPIETPAPSQDSGSEFSRIWMIFDAENCGGSGSHVFTAGGAKIASTTDEIAYHEMSHALRLIDFEQDILSGINSPDEEEEKVVERTNEYRTFKGGPSRASDPTNANFHQGGCGQADAISGVFCFVVTAAFGHPAHHAVENVQRRRDELIGRSHIAAQCYAAIKSEYDKFSPTLADAMRTDDELRTLVRTHLVEPLLLFADIASLFADRCDEFATLSDAIDCAMAECCGCKELDLDLFDPVVAQDVCCALEDLRCRLANKESRGAWLDGQFCLGRYDIRDAVSGIGDLMVDRGVDVTVIDWAIVRPLLLTWSSFQAIGAGSNLETVGRELVASVRSWFRATPWHALDTVALPDCSEGDLFEFVELVGSARIRCEFVAALREAFPSLGDCLEARYGAVDTRDGNILEFWCSPVKAMR